MRASRWIALAVLTLMATNAIADPELGDDRVGGRGESGDAAKQYSCEREQGMVAVTFKPETRLEDVITWAMGFTCRAFLYDPRIVATGRKVTIIAPERMSAADAYRAFLAALSTIGLTVVEDGGMLRIVEAPSARKEHVPLVNAHALSDRDELVRLAYHPDNVSADTIAKAFTAIKSDAGDVAVVGGLVLITDYAARIRDMYGMAKLVDVPGGAGDGIYTVPVVHADAHKLVDEIDQLLGSAPTAGAGSAAGTPTQPGLAPTKLIVDDRTNTLMMAGSVGAYERVRALVNTLDVGLEVESGQAFHIVPLHAAIAEELAATLTSSLLQSGVGAGSGSGARPATASGAPQTGATVGASSAIEGKVRVIADKPSNKLVVIAGGHDFLAVRSMIRELDVPRREVFIDAQILEVDLDSETDFGVSEHGTVPAANNTGVAVGGIQLPQLSSANPSSLASATGLIGGILGAPVTATTLLGTTFPSYGLLVNALATNSNTNLLSAPSILALDNDEAILKVGTNVPYQSGTTVTASAGVTQSISREDLTLELDIKPHISDDDVVLLEVKHDAKDLGSTTANLGPTWTTRSFQTKLLVRDQHTVAIGGLIEEREIRTVTKVPFLGDIPLLGYLFKYDSKVKKKSSLLIVLTPYIIRDQDDLERIRSRKQREHDELTRSFSTLAHMKYQPGIDYSRKRGLLEEINQTELEIEAERADLAPSSPPSPMHTGPISLDTPGSAR
jgi:general secretion pathway protein D